MNLKQKLDASAEMMARLQDYEREDPATILTRLVSRWRESFPEAAKEASLPLHPLMRMDEWRKVSPDEPDEIWFNDVYHVTVRRHNSDPVFGTNGGMIQLGINCHDGTARHDWRDFQAIKNQLAGPECEAFELYPAESRLLDPSNYYTLWCFPGVKRLKIGQPFRLVRDADQAWAAQRALPKVEPSAVCAPQESPDDPLGVETLPPANLPQESGIGAVPAARQACSTTDLRGIRRNCALTQGNRRNL